MTNKYAVHHKSHDLVAHNRNILHGLKNFMGMSPSDARHYLSSLKKRGRILAIAALYYFSNIHKRDGYKYIIGPIDIKIVARLPPSAFEIVEYAGKMMPRNVANRMYDMFTDVLRSYAQSLRIDPDLLPLTTNTFLNGIQGRMTSSA